MAVIPTLVYVHGIVVTDRSYLYVSVAMVVSYLCVSTLYVSVVMGVSYLCEKKIEPCCAGQACAAAPALGPM